MAADTVHRTDCIIVHTHTVADATVNGVHCLLLLFPFILQRLLNSWICCHFHLHLKLLMTAAAILGALKICYDQQSYKLFYITIIN